MIKQVDILLIGSSIIYNWKNIKKKFNDKKIINLGKGGLKTDDILDKIYFDKILLYKPKYIIYYCGGNDITNNISNENIYKNIIKFYKKIFKIFGNDIKIIFLSIIKSPEKRLLNKINDITFVNNKIKNFCQLNNVLYVNINNELKSTKLFKDDLNHLNNLGYDKINNKILQYIN